MVIVFIEAAKYQPGPWNVCCCLWTKLRRNDCVYAAWMEGLPFNIPGRPLVPILRYHPSPERDP